jgi:HK97 family phage portal protein
MGFLDYITSFTRRGERRFTSSEFESAVNKALTADMVADRTSRPAITQESSLALTAVWACVRILSETVGTLPIHLYRRTDTGRERQHGHPAGRILLTPNSFSTRFDLMHFLMVSCTLWGNGYARIYRDKLYRPLRLKYLHPAKVEPMLSDNGELFYRLDTGETLPADDIIHLKSLSTDGIKGKSPIAVHRDNLALSLSAQAYGEMFFNQGGNMSGVFKYPATMKPEAYERLRHQLIGQTVGLHKAHLPLLLEGGMTYERISIPPEDAQFIATRKFQKTEIATIYGVPPHMIADLERSTNNNIEHQAMEFVRYCLMPYLVRLEEEFNRKLLRHDEFEEYYYLFSLNGLLRGDAKTRSEFYKNMNFVGAMSANEIRNFEDMNSYEGGDEYFVQMNMQPVKHAINGKKNK